MLHFNRKTEYALIAMEHMLRKAENDQAARTSTREISTAYQISYSILAKVLQQLASKGMVKSVHGTKGGYLLGKPAQDISVADVAEIFEGSVAVAECFKEEKITCPQWDGCRIRHPLGELNHKIYNLLSQTTMADLSHGGDLSL